ncbi:tetratricopeptide repeat protein [Streptomyces hyaluromycini]|uniref:Tetratricopeptide repeat protein n=1 Tax=Streptomyces hyaluromycini TaxID=1377993 RepID=A0ABV1WP41_9ACTN
MLPSRAQSFQHRSEADQLRAAVDSGGTAVLSQVLTGTGGVGKTQLAADYARTAWDRGEVDVLVWVSASSRSAITTQYAQAAVELLAADPEDREQAARAFLAWLQPKAAQRPCRWLVVLDDVADPADMRGLWPPASPHGRVLVTTRRREAALTGDGRRLVTVGLFTAQEAASYFTAVFAAHDCHDEPTDEINGLAADLGYLPLALAQAAAYIIDTGLNCASYRVLFADQKAKLAHLLPEPGALPDDQTATVAATWALSIERANQIRPAGLAQPMLQLAAFLDPNGIPATVLTSQPNLAHLTKHRTPTGTGGADQAARVSAEEATLALRVLHRLSLIDHTPDTPHQAVRVHQLIQRATRDPLTQDERDRLALTAADTLTAAWPTIERDAALAQALRANTTALTRTAEDALYRPAPHQVLFRIGASLGESGQATAAVDHYKHLAVTARQRLGPEHHDTLAARGQLAHWRGKAGDAAEAAANLADLSAKRVRVQGPNHPETLASRHYLAHWRGEAGDAAGAAAAFGELLADMERVLGPDHPNTLAIRGQLVGWQGETGGYTGTAANAFEQLINDRVRVQGADHPETLAARRNLAHWRWRAGDTVHAAALLHELLADQMRVLGPDHRDTLATRSQLAHWRGKAGGYVGNVVSAFEQLINDRVRVQGADHPETLAARRDLAHWRGEAGDATGAAEALAELLLDQEWVQGPDHPDTLTTRHYLAHWRGKAGDAGSAADAFEQLINDRVRVLGADHPATLGARRDLAHWREQAGDTAGAAEAQAELLVNDRIRVLGADHPDTLTTRSQLAHWRGKAGDATGAATALAELLDDMERVLGADHPDTLTTRSQLAHWRGKAGDATGAATALAELLVGQERVLGRDHPDTLTTRHNLGKLLAELDPYHPPALETHQSLAYWWEEDVIRPARALAANKREAERRAEYDRLSLRPFMEERQAPAAPRDTPSLTAHRNLTYRQEQAGDASDGAGAGFEKLLLDRVRAQSPGNPSEFGSHCGVLRRLQDLPKTSLVEPTVGSTDFLGRPLAKPPANTVTPACRLCSYLGPSFPVGTPLPDVLAPIRVHMGEAHPDSEEAESRPKMLHSFPKMLHSYLPGLTVEVLLKVNTRRAENPYGDGTMCEPGCECGQ